MDFLRTLGLEDLPEQQTKTMHLMARHPEFALKLGLDSCCACGTPFTSSSSSRVVVDCPTCQRVSYCSEACRAHDASAGDRDHESFDAEDEEGDTAMGHSSVICTLLTLCNNDEVVNDETKDDDKTMQLLAQDARAKEAAIDRVRSEYESYCATVANVLLQGPFYGPAIEAASKNLVIHVIGASSDGELWQKSPCVQHSDVWNAYADALAELAETRKLDTINLVFVGPECPKENIPPTTRNMTNVEGGTAGELVVQTYCGEYTTDLLKQNEIPKADICIFFNPGFTCPDYDWSEALAAIPRGTPFLMTTNTELEGIADCQYLLENDLIQAIPPMLAEIFGSEALAIHKYEDDDGTGPFFNENPFCGNRVRQSGTMANDLFVKNRWMLGGILDSRTRQPPNKRRVTSQEGNNSKVHNPALI
mgnify:CR=1 FL=1